MSVLSVSGLGKTFGGLKAVANVDLEVERGEMHGLIGANGAGKTTLLHLIYGRIRPDRGSIHFNGTDVTL
ncbi:MAG: ATP-binding cassette domain-containing protein, partial [Acidimicrobiia bacterium]